MLVVSWFICGVISLIVYCYLFNKFLKTGKFKIDLKLIICSLFTGLLYFAITKLNYIYIRPYLVHFLIFLELLFLYRQKVLKTIIVMLCFLIVLCISEFLCSFVVVILFKGNLEFINSMWFGYLLSNVMVYTTMLVLSKISFVKTIISSIIDWYIKNEYKSIMISLVFFMIVFTFFLYNNFVKLLPNQLLWLTNMFCIAVTFFVINYFKEKANNNRIVTEYDQLLKYVNKYEKVVEDKSKRQHEYKNQLVLIKGMINKTNKKAIEYIDSLYEEEKDDSNLEMLKKLQYLPSGGLKGLIYYKLEDMKDKKINVFVDISPKAKNVKVNKKIDSNLKDISKVIGVYLDNAIEASVHSKEKYIVLEIYLDKDEWVFSLSNTYKGEINLNRIDNEGYTTKGSGKGYGLSLVKDIIEHNSDLRQERELRGIYYTQKLYMKK